MVSWRDLSGLKPIQQARLEDLSASFPEYLDIFNAHGPFSQSQLGARLRALKRRVTFGSAAEAVADPDFADAVRYVLAEWGIGTRGAQLVPPAAFRTEMAKLAPKLAELEGAQIDDTGLDAQKAASTVWDVISSMCLVAKNSQPVKNRLVSGSKALHHVLPTLVFPIDREYTQTFFGWHNPEFQYNPRDCFILIFVTLADLATRVHTAQFVGDLWMSSSTKILDNAIVGFCIKHGLKSESTRYEQKRRATLKAIKKLAKEMGD